MDSNAVIDAREMNFTWSFCMTFVCTSNLIPVPKLVFVDVYYNVNNRYCELKLKYTVIKSNGSQNRAVQSMILYIIFFKDCE